MFVDGLILYCLAAVLDLQPRIPLWPTFVRVLGVGLMAWGTFGYALHLVLKHGTLDLWEAIVR